ncbi:hypothetical protein D3C78_764200 [compost metagenome]
MRYRHHRPFKIEFLLAFGIEYAPVGAYRALVTGFPGLVVGFDDEIVVATAVEGVDQRAQVDGLVGLGGVGAAAHAAVARPADFREQQWLARELLFQLTGPIEDELHGILHGHELPVGQDVRGNQVDMLGQFRVFLPDVPLFTGGYRHLDCGSHPVKVLDQCFGRDLFAEQRFVADHHANHAARGVGQFDGRGDLTLVALQVRADPDAQGDAKPKLLCQPRDIGLGAFDGVDTDAVGQLVHLLQVLAHLGVAWVLAFLRALPQTEWRVRET